MAAIKPPKYDKATRKAAMTPKPQAVCQSSQSTVPCINQSKVGCVAHAKQRTEGFQHTCRCPEQQSTHKWLNDSSKAITNLVESEPCASDDILHHGSICQWRRATSAADPLPGACWQSASG